MFGEIVAFAATIQFFKYFAASYGRAARTRVPAHHFNVLLSALQHPLACASILMKTRGLWCVGATRVRLAPITY